MQISVENSALYGWFERPAALIALTARMLIGFGLGIALILQVYMYLLTDFRCEAEGTSLGNSIRCMPAFDMVAIALALVAGIGFAAALFAKQARGDLIDTVFMALCAAILRFLSGLEIATAGWQTALMVLALFVALIALNVFRNSRLPALSGGDVQKPPT
ncbi:MAG: hypothetical protein AAGF94_10905 [Pseudomonadota bacterium]